MTLIALLFPPLLGGCGGDPDAGLADAGPPDGQCPAPGERPGKRSEHVVVLAGDDLVIYGGTTAIPTMCDFPAPIFTDETWRYDTRCGVFSRVEAKGPGPRARAMGAYDAANDRVLVFGGRTRETSSGPYTLFDDLWALGADDSWTQIEATGPGARVAGAMGVDPTDGKVWIFGGDSSPSGTTYAPLSDTWSYDPGGGGWTQATTATTPEARLLVGSTFDADRRRLLVYGGVASFFATSFADLWALDVTVPEWTRLHDGTGTAPDGRFFPSIAWEGDRTLLFGGHDATDLGNRNDLWAFDPETNAWDELAAGDVWANDALGPCDFPPDFATVDLTSPERRSSLGMTAGDGVMWIFGGKSDCGALDDVWSWDGTWHERTAATAGEVCLRFFADTPKYECAGLCL